jgi:adenylate cyclase
MDAIEVESERPAPQAALASPEAANPLVGWLLREAPAAPSARDLVEQFARAMLAGGIPAWRLWLSIRTLHPQLVSTNFIWEDNGKGVQQGTVTREMLLDQRFLDSPVKAIFEGAGGCAADSTRRARSSTFRSCMTSRSRAPPTTS